MYLNSSEHLIFEQKSEQEGDRLPPILLPLPYPCGRRKGERAEIRAKQCHGNLKSSCSGDFSDRGSTPAQPSALNPEPDDADFHLSKRA